MTLTSFRRFAVAFLTVSTASAATGQASAIADVHFHDLGPRTDSSLRAMEAMGVKTVVMIGTPAQLATIPERAGMRIIRALTLPCPGGRMPNAGIPCYSTGGEWPVLDSVRAMVRDGRVQMFGEINAQYGGIRVDDPAMEPWFALAEELDIPVGVHLGIGPPGIAYADHPGPRQKSPAYSGAAGDPLALESVLRRHPKLRVYVMHAAWPMRDAMLYMLYMHPRLHVDVSVLQYAIPRAAYLDYLRDLVNSGFGRRIMFGSDGSAARVKEGIDAIRTADFLDADQQADVLGRNAERFFQRDTKRP